MAGYGNPYSGEGFGAGLERGIGIVLSLRQQEAAERRASLEEEQARQQMDFSKENQGFARERHPLEMQGMQLGLDANKAALESAERVNRVGKATEKADIEAGLMKPAIVQSELDSAKASRTASYASARVSNAQAARSEKEKRDLDEIQIFADLRAKFEHYHELYSDPQFQQDAQIADLLINHPQAALPPGVGKPEFIEHTLGFFNKLVGPDLQKNVGQMVDNDIAIHDNIPLGSKVLSEEVVNFHMDNPQKPTKVVFEIQGTARDVEGKEHTYTKAVVRPMAAVSKYIKASEVAARTYEKLGVESGGDYSKIKDMMDDHMEALSLSNPKYVHLSRGGAFNSATGEWTASPSNSTGDSLKKQYMAGYVGLVNKYGYDPQELQKQVSAFKSQALSLGLQMQDQAELEAQAQGGLGQSPTQPTPTENGGWKLINTTPTGK